MKKTFPTLICCALLFSLTGCGDGSSREEKPAALEPEEIPGLFRSVQSNGLEIVLKASQVKYKPGDEVLALAVIRNTTDQSLYYQTVNSCDSGVQIEIPIDSGRHFVEVEQGEPKACAEIMGAKELKPNETITEQVTFQAKDHQQKQNVQPGTYQIIVRSTLLTHNEDQSINFESPTRVETSAAFTVEK